MKTLPYRNGSTSSAAPPRAFDEHRREEHSGGVEVEQRRHQCDQREAREQQHHRRAGQAHQPRGGRVEQAVVAGHQPDQQEPRDEHERRPRLRDRGSAAARSSNSASGISSSAREPAVHAPRRYACTAAPPRLRGDALQSDRWRASEPRKGLTVAVTGPTGEIGQAVVRRSSARARWGASWAWPAGRSTRARGAGRRSPTGAATCSTAAAVSALVERRRRGRAPGVHDHGRRQREPRGQPRRLAQRVRGDRRGGRETARLRLLGRRVRLPPRQPAAADRGRARARHRRALLLGAEGRGRGAARATRSHGSATASYVFRPCIVAGPQAPLLIDSLPYTQISERLPGPVLGAARRSADPQARAARPWRALPAGAPRRRRQRDARGRARPRRARRLQPRRARTA